MAFSSDHLMGMSRNAFQQQCADKTATQFSSKVVESTSSKIRTFLYELAEGTTNYRSLHSLTEQVEHQYHGRFLVELIQNAHDALLSEQTDPSDRSSRIEIVLAPDEEEHGTLYVANDGRPFSPSNFKSLSQLGQSDKDPQESIGNKGIGFRSVLEITDSPEVYSRSSAESPLFDGFCFAFSPVVIDRLAEPIIALLGGDDSVPSPLGDMSLVDWDGQLLQKFRSSLQQQGESWLTQEVRYLSPYLLPFPVSPSPANQTLQDLEKRGFATVIRLPLKGANVCRLVQEKLEELDASTILFLDKATSLVLDSGASRREICRRSMNFPHSRHSGREVDIAEGNAQASQKYWLWTTNIKVSEAPPAFQKAVSELPGKWPELREVAVTIGVRLGNEPTKGVFSIFLPTLLGTGSATHINAPFLGDMSRTHIDFKLTYNRLLLQEATSLAIQVVLHELAGKGTTEARSIIDILAPWDSESEPARLWRDFLKEASATAGVNLDEANLFLSNKGWRPLKQTFLITRSDSASVITQDALRKHATFAAFSSELDSRSRLLEALSKAYGVEAYPSLLDLANTVESLAQQLHKLEAETDWNGFWTDVDTLFKGDSSSLCRKKILLGNDGELHSSGDECAVFFIPRRGSIDDEEVENEGAILNIPPALKRHIAFLSERIRVYDERDARVQTKIRKFLDTNKLVSRFRVDAIFTDVLIPRTPKLPAPLDGPESPLCRDILLWGLQLMSNLVDRGKGEKSLRLLRSLPVPCLGGWHKLEEASFGPGWPGTIGEEVHKYLNGVNSEHSQQVTNRLLLPPSHQLWGQDGVVFQELLSQAGVFDGLRLMAVASKDWGSCFSASVYDFQLPKAAPIGVGERLWEDYRAYVKQRAKPLYQGWFRYEIQSLNMFPGLERYSELDEATRLALMEVLLGSIPRWGDAWKNVSIRKMEGNADTITLDSPLTFGLKKLPWLGLRKDETLDWSCPSERWHVPAGTLSGRPRQFAHLRPLPGALAQRLDSNPQLSVALQWLGMPRFDTDTPSESTRLLDALAEAASDDEIFDWNVFLGQVRDAWNAFFPKAGTRFPKKIIVSQGKPPFYSMQPAPESRIYLPNSTSSFVAALEQFALPLVAMRESDAKRLAQSFKAAYGEGIQLVSELEVIPLVGGVRWQAEAGTLLPNSELEWLIPLILTLVAFHGPQAKGTNAKRFREQLTMLQDARFCWVANLEVGLYLGDMVVAKVPEPAIWLDKEKLLLVSEECHDKPSGLSESLSHLIQREDLELPIKLVLNALSSLEPEPEEITRALGQLKLNENQYREAREHWRGDLGQLIRMIQPLVFLLKPDADVGVLVDLDTEEAVTAFLDRLNDPRLEGKSLLQMARVAPDIFRFGFDAYRRFGEQAQLGRWNSVLVSLGQPTLTNPSASEDFRAHLRSVSQPLLYLVVPLIRRNPAVGLFKELSEQLGILDCPKNFESEFWDVSFNKAIRETLPILQQWGATAEELMAVREADSSEDLVSRLQTVGVDVTFDPIKASKDNRELLKETVQRLQKIGLAWALRQQPLNVFDWENRTEGFMEALSGKLDRTGFTSRWSDKDVFALLKTLPQDEASASFWQGLEQSSNLEHLIQLLGVSGNELEEAEAKLERLKEEARKRKKLIKVCGKEFDSSEDNLSQLWTHICAGIPDQVLDTLQPVDVSKPESLLRVTKPTRKKREAERKESPKPKPRLSKSIENLIGLSGEIHAFRILQKTYGTTSVTPSAWVSGNSTFVFPDNKPDDGSGCDFVFNLNGKTYYIEVKASEGEDESFTLGSSEIRRAMELAKKRKRRRKEIFLVLRITNALSTHPSFQVLPNPYDSRYQSLFLVEETDARVRYKLS